jgi:hypothetical protein
MRCRMQRMARGRSANLVIPLFLDSMACVTAVTLRPTRSPGPLEGYETDHGAEVSVERGGGRTSPTLGGCLKAQGWCTPWSLSVVSARERPR